MERTIRNLMDAFIQHLAANRGRLWELYKAGKPIEPWLRREMISCIDYLRDVNKFRNLFEGENRRRRSSSKPENSMDLHFEGRNIDLWIEIGVFSTERDLDRHLEDIRGGVDYLKGISGPGLRLWLEFMISRGKWAHRTIDDCMRRVEERLGLHMEPYTPSLRLTPSDAFQNLLDEPVVLRLFCGYIEDQSPREE